MPLSEPAEITAESPLETVADGPVAAPERAPTAATSAKATEKASGTVTIAHLGDLHFGFSQLNRRTPDGARNQREADVERAALLVADYLVEEARPDVVVVAGDMLDATRISTAGLIGARRFVHRFRDAGIPLIVIGGNHDHVESPIVPMLRIFEQDGALVFLEARHLDLAGARFHLVPFRPLARSIRRPEDEPVEFDFSDALPNVLVSHASVEGKAFKDEDVEVPWSWLEEPRFALVLLGHIHDRGLALNDHSFYSGALEVMNFGERDKVPGFLIHRLEQGQLVASEEVEVANLALARGLDLTPRPVLQFTVDAEEQTLEDVDRQVRKLIGSGVRGAMAKLVVQNVSSAFAKSSFRKDWQQAFQDAGGFDLEVDTHTRRVGELLDVEFAAPPVDLAQAFAEWLAEQEFPDESKRQTLSALGREVLESAREKLIAQEG